VTRPTRIAVVSVLVASIVTGCVAQEPVHATPPSTSAPSGSSERNCVPMLGGDTELSWSADGSSIAVLMDFSSATGAYSYVDVVSWPSLTVRQQYRPAYELGPVVPSFDGSSLYWLGKHDGMNGFWSLSASGDSTLIGTAPDEVLNMAVATPDGIVWSSFTDFQTLTLTVRKMDWTSHTETIVPARPPVLQTWIDGQGQWIVLSSKTASGGQQFQVLHGGEVTTVTSPTTARLVGMSPDRADVIYRPESNLSDYGTSIELHLLALAGGADDVVSVPIPSGLGASPLALSSTGVLAYGDQGGFANHVCFSAPALVQGK